jgi:hypothetical protein
MEKDQKSLKGTRILYRHFVAENLKQLGMD